MKKIIGPFINGYRWLSNFYPSEVVYADRKYPTVEHAYVASKTLNETDRSSIQLLKTPSDAKKFGKKVTLRSDWNHVRLYIMEDLIRQKFHNEALRTRLINTGDAELIEINMWKDTFWGVCNGVGENNLGKILMKIRSEILNNELP